MVACRQIECMAASASAQQAAHAEAEQQLLECLKSAEASLAGCEEAEQALKAGRPFSLISGCKLSLYARMTSGSCPQPYFSPLAARSLSILSNEGLKTALT